MTKALDTLLLLVVLMIFCFLAGALVKAWDAEREQYAQGYTQEQNAELDKAYGDAYK